jgi:hypothetical protein
LDREPDEVQILERSNFTHRFNRSIEKGSYTGAQLGVSTMQRYFFDYVSNDRTLFDHQGQNCATNANARDQAELLAIHLQHDPEAAYVGWSIVVRDVRGTEVCSVPVPAANGNQFGKIEDLSIVVVLN